MPFCFMFPLLCLVSRPPSPSLSLCTASVLCPPLTPIRLIPQCDKEIEQVQSQLEDYKDPPLSLSRLSLKQQKFKTFRETANVSVRRLLLLISWCSIC